MKKRALSFVVAVVLTLAGCHSHTEAARAAQSATPSFESGAGAQRTQWTCPMHPQIRSDKPGKCPICGMTLVKRASGVASTQSASAQMPEGHARIELSQSREQMIGVKTGVVEKRPLFKDIEASGRLAFDPELYTAQTDYAEALLQLERVKGSPLADVKQSARRMVESAKLRLKILGLSDKQIARIGAGEGGESNLLITKPGQSVWIYADIFEMDLPYVREGQSAEISADFLGGKTLAGKVVSVDRVINPVSRTAKARILVAEGSTFLRPESYVDVTIHAPLGEQITVPFDAILDTGKQSWVFLVTQPGEFTPRLVHIKFYAGNDVAIGEGLSGGEKIVTSANFLIDSESRLESSGFQIPDETSAAAGARKPALPICPKGQHWDLSMSMCMAN